MKVLLILVDGMRPDALTDIPQVRELMKKSSHTMHAQTVFPSSTLPCHMSLFHSVEPSRHGTATNTYAPQVRPIKGLCEVLRENDKKCAFFYDWEQLRDLTRPGSLAYSEYINGSIESFEGSHALLTEHAMNYIAKHDPDFTFLYWGWTDVAGHDAGWMSEEYLHAMGEAWKSIGRVVNSLPEDYVVIITADHGGHERTHGTDLPEDMIIPMFFLGGPFAANQELEGVSLKDIAPTIAALLQTSPAPEWEGKVLYS